VNAKSYVHRYGGCYWCHRDDVLCAQFQLPEPANKLHGQTQNTNSSSTFSHPEQSPCMPFPHAAQVVVNTAFPSPGNSFHSRTSAIALSPRAEKAFEGWQ
jgi:hypothetical protein